MSTNDVILASSDGNFNPATASSGLQAAYHILSTTSPSSITDLSGNGRTLTPISSAPTLSTFNGHPCLLYSGSGQQALITASSFNYTHMFLAAAYDGTGTGNNFADYCGLIGPNSADAGLVGGSGSNSWFNFVDGISILMNGSSVAPGASIPGGFCADTMQVIQASYGSAQAFTGGMEIGQHKTIAGRYWKGPIAGWRLIYNNASMTAAQATYIRKSIGASVGVATA